MIDDRAVSPVVEKTLAIGLVVLYVSLVAVTVYGGVLPDFRTAAGERVGERTLATASQRVQQAVPPNATAASARVRVDLPATIRGDGYAIRAEGETLVLDHPDEGIGGRSRLGLPGHVSRVEGRWESGSETVVVVRQDSDGLVVRLEDGGER
jgi:hypothetical protein